MKKTKLDENGNQFLWCPRCKKEYRNYEYIDPNTHGCIDELGGAKVPQPKRVV